MDQQTGQQDTALMRLGEALMFADRCRNEGRLMEAEAACRQILQTQPKSPEAEHLLGVIAHQNGKFNEAIEHVQRAVTLAPQVALFHANLCEMLRLAGRHRLAVESARRALAIEPTMPMALSNLGVALYELKDYDEAARAQRQAVAVNPGFAEAHSNLGNALYALRQFDEAVAAFRRALELKPDFADAWANLGTTLHHAGSFEEGMIALRRAIALAPGHANAHSGLGILLLMRGDFGEGWDEYEWRLRSTERKGPRFPEKPWHGENLAGKHIYVQAEQGFGDSLQFVRYVPLVAQRAGRVTLRVHQQLVTLFRESLPGITVLGDRGDPAPRECDAVLLSLPRLFKTRLETIPVSLPYLRAPRDSAERWKNRLAKMTRVKVGLLWAGNPDHANDTRRSIDVELLAPLLAVPGTSFASLQVGPRAADLQRLQGNNRPSIEDLSPDLNDFADTAGAIGAVDLVITVDTSVAHLAGALGKPVWVLLPWVTDWRWMLGREDSPWYPTMRLFRQHKGQDWADVIALVAKELEAVAQGNEARLMPFKAQAEYRAEQAAAIMAAEATHAVSPTGTQSPTMMPGQALLLADQKRRQGFLADADELTRHAVSSEPDNAEAVHMLGLIAHQSGKLDEAIKHVRRAIAVKPDVALYHANLGEMCRLAGRPDEAIAAGRRALEINPTYPAALSNLGIALFEQGKFEEALALYDRAVALEEDFAQGHSNRGNALQRLKRFSDAEAAYRRALALQPNFVDAWNNLGTCLRELKRSQDAESAYRKALQFNPNNPDTLDNLGLALKDLERLDEAAEFHRRTVTVEPRSDKFFLHYGSVLLDLHKVEEAAAAAERAVALNASNHDTINLIGRVALERGEADAALAYFRRALALKPDFADAHNSIGNVLKELGQLEGAQAAYLEALRLDPRSAGVYVNLSDSKTFTPADPHLAAMEALAANPEALSKNERLQLDFALGKAYADVKDWERSFAHLSAGNAAKRASVDYDEKSTFALFDRIEAVFTHALMQAKSGSGDASSLPIFVIGMPRSGTTLIEQIIASHPLVHGAGELQAFNETILMVRDPDGNVIPYPEFVAAADASVFKEIAGRYIATLRSLAAAANSAASRPGSTRSSTSSPGEQAADSKWERITDKMPSNYYFAGLIHLALPNAPIIHAIRDPVDTCVSCFSKLFSAELNHTYDLGELGRYCKRYDRLMAHWRSILPKGRMLEVRYEDIVADMEGAARRIIAYCGLPWDERCLSFHKTVRPVKTASATQVRRPIYKSSVGRWRVYEKHLGPLLSAIELDRSDAGLPA